MEGLSVSFAWLIRVGQILLQKCSYGFDLRGCGNFASVLVGDVKHIGNLIDVRGNLRDVNRRSKLVQAVGDREQNADTIFSKDFGDREVIGSVVVDVYNG